MLNDAGTFSSLRAMKLAAECCALFVEELDKPEMEITDAMIVVVINLAGHEVSVLLNLQVSAFGRFKKDPDSISLPSMTKVPSTEVT